MSLMKKIILPTVIVIGVLTAHVSVAQADTYTKAYKLRNNPHALIKFSQTMRSKKDGLTIIQMGLKEDPGNAVLLGWAGWYFAQIGDLEAAKKHYYLALDKSVKKGTGNWQTMNDLYKAHTDDGEFEDAAKLMLANIKHFPPNWYSNLYELAINAYLGANDLQKAKNVLNNAYAKGVEKRHLKESAGKLDFALGNRKGQDAYFKNNPFLADWEHKFGKSLSLSVEFKTGSAIILSKSHVSLDKAARALKAKGGDNYVFRVEGHTDSEGGDHINIPLSKRRAESVKDYFFKRHGISPARLTTVGFGATTPIATNTTTAGKQKNRRVEIRPFGNLHAPEIAMAKNFTTNHGAFSPDGRYLVSGTTPLRVWDLEQRVNVKNLSRGGMFKQFSPNGRYLAVQNYYYDEQGTFSGEFYIHDVKTGLIESIFPRDSAGEVNTVFRLAWSPFSDELAVIGDSARVRIFNLKTKRIRASKQVTQIQFGGRLIWTKDGKHLVFAQLQHKRAYVLNASNLSIQKVLSDVDWVHAIGQSSDGSIMMFGNNDSTISFYNTRTWELLSRIKNPTRTPDKIHAVPGKPWFVYDDKFDDKIVTVIEAPSGRVIAKKDVGSQPSISVSADGKSVRLLDYKGLRTLELANLTERERWKPETITGVSMHVDKERGLILTSTGGGTAIWDLEQGRRIHSLSMGGWEKLTDDGKTMVSYDKDGNLITLDIDTFKVTKHVTTTPGLEVYGMDLSANHILLRAKDVDTGKRPKKNGAVVVIDRKSLKKVATLSVPHAPAPLKYSLWKAKLTSAMVIEDSGLVAVSTRYSDGGRSHDYSKLVQIFNLRSGARKGVVESSGFIWKLEDDPKDKTMVWGIGESSRYKISGTKLKVIDSKARDFNRIKLKNGSEVVWDKNRVVIGDKRLTVKERILNVAVDENRNLLLTYNRGNEISYYNIHTLKRQLTLLGRPNNQWLAYAQSGEFNASINGTKGIFWSMGDNFMPFDALKDRFEKPNLIQRKLKALFANHDPEPDKPEPKKIVIEPDVFQLPFKVTLNGSGNVTTSKEEYVVLISVEKLDKNKPDPDYRFTVNGRSSRGFDEDVVFDGTETLKIKRKVPLREGENIIEAHLMYKGVKAHTTQIKVTRKSKVKRKNKTRLTQQLWFFGVGVSDYAKSSQNLNYAHKDALMLEKVFKAQEGKLFAKVNTKVLVNENATARNVKVQLYKFLKLASSEDLIIMFVAGHGVQDNQQNLYFMTHDGDLKEPFTGLEIEVFRKVLEQRPINQKAMFLMDICHAGTSGPRRRGRVTVDDAVKQLASGTGTVVYASSTGAESSLEDEKWGHGAFTHALLKGLKGMADKEAGDENGVISVQELISYASRQVPRLTDGAQHPSVPLMENLVDFPLSIR